MKMKKLLIPLFLCCAVALQAQPEVRPGNETPEFTDHFYTHTRDLIRVPDIPGYTTLKCDFHIHSAYSDGSVWPDVRVNEAWNEGLDAIAITEHIEYRPRVKEGLVCGDQNQSYKIAAEAGERMGILVVPGAEITRQKPFGHMNAFFLTDANALDTDDPVQAVENAVKQGAFIMWNHPGWPDRQVTMYDVHRKLIDEGKIHGIELINGPEYHPKAIAWCKENRLAYMCGSDAHQLITGKYGLSRMPRPMTLVFAKERSVGGIKEALFARRSAVMFHDLLIGPADLLRALMDASLDYRRFARDDKNKTTTYDVTNNSDISYKVIIDELPVILRANSITRIRIPDAQRTTPVLNCLITADETLEAQLPEARIL
ncbi:MAG: PHP domain-containing protein [Alistipes sp.]|nr:PHP domain-containing protein [Alistipes sp.]